MPDPARPRCVLVACMRNEGLFVLEWLAYHRLLGFDDILVFTNGCTDGSDLLLSRLDALGHVTHVDHVPPDGVSPQLAAMEIAFRHPKVVRADWMMHIDADEFVNVGCGDGSVQALLAAAGPADVVALLWRPFGSAGLTRWDGGSVLTSFTRAQARPKRRTVHHKSIWRVGRFGRAIDHMPKDPLVADYVVRNTAGEPINGAMIRHPVKCRYKAEFRHLTFDNACINHYALKSDDLLLMKNDRGDGHGNSHQNYYLNSNYHRKNDQNEVEERSILARWQEVERLMAEMRSDDAVRALDRACLEAFRARRDRVLTSERVAAWTLADAPA